MSHPHAIAGHSAFAPVEPFKQQWRKAQHPSMHGRMIDMDIALLHHFFQIAQTQTIGEVPAHAQQND
jgi:hypothetical protein